MSKHVGRPSAPDGELVDVADLRRDLEAERTARIRAEQALSARDEIIAMVSHDLRNPLSSVMTSAAIMQRLLPVSTDPRWRSCLDNIRRACERMRRLISDILDASEMDAGTFAITEGQCDAAALIDEIARGLEVMAADKGLELVAVLPERGLTVRCDRERLLQVLENLVANAIKFTEQGRVTVMAVPDGERIRFSVADTGPGIAEDQRQRVFDKFWRGDGSKTGVGLGLAIARGIVAAHGGRIWVDSEPGRGAVFHFTVPRAAATVRPHATALEGPPN